jgi:hypothetical protein
MERNFAIVVKFRCLKGGKEKGDEKVLPMTAKSPRLEKNMRLSLPHGLSVKILLWCFLQDHTTVKSLFNELDYQICIKDTMDKPIFSAALSRRHPETPHKTVPELGV